MGRWIIAGVAVVVIVAGLVWWQFGGTDAEDPTAGGEPTEEAAAEPEPDRGFLPGDEVWAEAEDIVAGLDSGELAGQLIIARYTDDAGATSLVRDRNIAGIIRTGDHIDDAQGDDPLVGVRSFNAGLHEAGEERGVPVMIPVDQEGGTVTRLRAPLTEFPSAMAFGAATAGGADDPSAVIAAATAASGAELRDAGYNAVFAPVADTTVGPADPVIGSRSPGGDPEVVSEAALSATGGYVEAGIIATVKHFPGHNVTEDSHFTLPVLEGSLEELRDHDLVPFAAAADAGVPAIMVGHLSVEALDPGVPATLSSAVVTTELRDELGYEGLIVTDALDMDAVTDLHGPGEAAVEAIKAGNDLAVMPTDPVAAHEALTQAIESGDLDEEQVRTSATRVVAAVLQADTAEVMPGEPGTHDEQAADLARAALTVVACEEPPSFDAVQPVGDPQAVRAFEAAASEHGLATGSGPRVALVRNTPVSADVVVALDAPYLLADSGAPTKLAVYGDNAGSMTAVVEWLAGELEAVGGLPVDVPGVDPDPCP